MFGAGKDVVEMKWLMGMMLMTKRAVLMMDSGEVMKSEAPGAERASYTPGSCEQGY